MQFDKFWEIMVDDLGHHDSIREIPTDVLLGARERDLVDPVVHFGEFLLAEGRCVHLNL